MVFSKIIRMTRAVIIIGAGAAGLMAGRELSAAGIPVTILEAAPVPGGRIRTLQGPEFPLSASPLSSPDPALSPAPASSPDSLSSPGAPTNPPSSPDPARDRVFSGPIEAGAEFVHGNLPLTLGLLKAADIGYRPVKGQMVRVRKGEWGSRDIFSGDWDLLMEKMGQLQQDISIAAFLDSRFPGERYAALRDSIRSFAEGYDLADIQRASTLALYREWQGEGETEYRVNGGYGRLIQFLADQCTTHGCSIRYRSVATRIDWSPGKVDVTLADGQTFSGSHLIVTVSLGILQQEPASAASSASSPAALSFFPPIPAYRAAARQLGYGSVIKILMEFRRPFWEPKASGTGFILSDEAIPTWWLQAPDNRCLLTGWLTGRAMRTFRQLEDEAARLDSCLVSLAAIFAVNTSFLKEQLMAYRIIDWMQAPFIQGGYSFETVDCASARKLLRQPVEGTLIFAGEALYDGAAPATVEAALTSGKEAAEIIKPHH